MENQESSVPKSVENTLTPTDELLKKAWGSYTQRWRTYTNIVAVGIIATLLPSFAGMSLFSTLVLSDTSSGGMKIFGILLVVSLIIIAIIATLWSTTALMVAIRDAGEDIGLQESYRRGWKLVLPYLWITVLGSLASLGGALLAIIPGIIVGIWVMFGSWIFISGEEKGLNALVRSREYVRGYWWNVLWRAMVIGLLSIGTFIALTLLLTIIGVMRETAESVANVVTSIVVSPFALVYTYHLYQELKSNRKTIIQEREGTNTRRMLTIVCALGIAFFVALIVLVPLLVPNLKVAREKAEEAQQQVALLSLQIPLEFYKAERGTYPETLEMLIPQYLDQLPRGSEKNITTYERTDDGASYELCIVGDDDSEKEEPLCTGPLHGTENNRG